MGGATRERQKDEEKQSRLRIFNEARDAAEISKIKEKMRREEIIRECNGNPKEFIEMVRMNTKKLEGEWYSSPPLRTHGGVKFLFNQVTIPGTEPRVPAVKFFAEPGYAYEIVSEIASEKGMQTDKIVDEMTAIHKRGVREKYEYKDYASEWLLDILKGERTVLSKQHLKIGEAAPEIRAAYAIEGLREGGLRFITAARVGSVNTEAGLNISRILLEKRSELEGEYKYHPGQDDPHHAPLRDIQKSYEEMLSIPGDVKRDKLALRLELINGLQDLSRLVSAKAIPLAVQHIENAEQLRTFWETFDALGRNFFKRKEEVSVPVKVHICDQYGPLSEDPVLRERLSSKKYDWIMPTDKKIEAERIRRHLESLKIVGLYFHHLGVGEVLPKGASLTKEQSDAVSRVEKEFFAGISPHTLLKNVEDKTEHLPRTMSYEQLFFKKGIVEKFADSTIPLEDKKKFMEDGIEELRDKFSSEKWEETRVINLILVTRVKSY